MKHSFSPKHGSALLIVLGLLSFLMISAVAFSISMRTERSAAAAYRRNLLARELLATTFTDARATVEYAMLQQRGAGFDRNDISTRTVERLAPFKYPTGNRYGRMISSRNTGTRDATEENDPADEPIAYLLDDATMRHVPPYVASAVYQTLEKQEPAYNPDGSDHKGLGNRYYIDWSAGWKPVVVDIPEQDGKVDGGVVSGANTGTAIVGRMAWAAINLSDSLDVNAIGSASQYRGLGLTGNEFAFGTAATGSSGNQMFDLIDPVTDPAASTLDLPTFCSNADLAQYAARISSATPLVFDTGSEAPYSWEEAVATKGDGFYSPFSVYSLWPNTERTKEDGTRTTASSGTGPIISCNDVTESSIAQGSSGTGASVISLVRSTLGVSDDTGDNFLRMLGDYIDKDSAPALFDTSCVKDLYNNAQPTVENVPMVSEVGFSYDGWKSDDAFAKDLEKAIETAFKDQTPEGGPFSSLDDIPSTLGDKSYTLSLPAAELKLGFRGYFPGAQESDQSYSITPEGFVGVIGSGVITADKKDFAFATAFGTVQGSFGGSTLDINGGNTPVFVGTGSTPSVSFKGSSLPLEINGKDIPVANTAKATPEDPKEIKLSFLVDFIFRMQVKGGGNDVVDLCPTDYGTSSKRGITDYPQKAKTRLDEKTMGYLDAQFFRVTRPVTVTFALTWKINESTGTDGAKQYTCTTVFDPAQEPKVTIDPGAKITIAGQDIAPAGTSGKPSWQTLSDQDGTWFAVDPRYNWLSPMLGVASNDSAVYFGSAPGNLRANVSSPHWVFREGDQPTSGSSSSPIQEAYANAHKSDVPFSWGLNIEDLRYGHNDSGQLLLPAEVGFLPVPLSTTTWHPNQRAYLSNSFTSYHNNVARRSFFRTLPAVDLKDSALSQADYTKYIALSTMFKGFGGDSFPEEHRGIVNVFAGQDDYLLAQRLRQFAMLGIPSSIRQAAYITYQRLNAARDAKRIADGMVDKDLKALADLPGVTLGTPKYDDFVRDYLFPLPKTSGGNLNNAKDWSKNQTLYEGKDGIPDRPKNLNFIVQDSTSTAGASFADRLTAYNQTKSSGEKLGQNDMTTLLAVSKECFGDRQQLFLYVLRADSIAYNSGRDLSQHKPLATARAVALVWRDAYGELPDRVIYYQLIP